MVAFAIALLGLSVSNIATPATGHSAAGVGVFDGQQDAVAVRPQQPTQFKAFFKQPEGAQASSGVAAAVPAAAVVQEPTEHGALLRSFAANRPSILFSGAAQARAPPSRA